MDESRARNESRPVASAGARHRRVFVAATLFLAALFGVGELSPALAQERPRTIFDLLFRPREKTKPAITSPRKTTPSKKTKSAARRKAAGPSAADTADANSAPSVVEKTENARVVLVVGDFVAGGLADGLVEAFASSPAIRIVDKSSGSSGFVRDDYYDWPGQIAGIIEAEKPALVIAMVGANDRQQMKIGTVREQPLTDAWLKEYAARADAFARAVRGAGLPLVWVGQPSFKPTSMANGMIALNDVFRTSAEKAGSTYVDIWDGFVDENGAFITTGPDIKGQPARLRANDGINLTSAGRRKIAFYAEKPIAKLLGTAAAQPNALPSTLAPADRKEETAPVVDRTPPIALNDPALDGGSELLGRIPVPDGKQAPRLDTPPPAGRADDFSAPAVMSRTAAIPGTAETESSSAR